MTAYPDSNYVTGISTLNSYSNVVTVGYVHTSYGTQPYSTLTANVTKYFNWSGYSGANIKVNGIFFDEAPSASDSNDYTYMSNAASFAHGGVSTVIFNPGQIITQSQYFDAADIVLDYENTYATFDPNTTPQSIPSQYHAKSAIVLNTTPSASDVAGVVNSVVSNGIGAVYLTDDCCYNDLNLLSTVASAVAATQ